ncbi:MAG TPA: NAD-dependent epimerase/dehydratase family protein, partial [Polyangiales bacterium]
GTSGFIGSNLRDALLRGGADVISLLRPVSPPSSKGRSVGVAYEDLEGLTRVIATERPDYVFHVAGATKGVTFEDFRVANVVPTVNLAEALVRAHPGVKRYLFVSSLTAWGPSNDGPPKREEDPPEPVEHYGRSKLEAERALSAFSVPWTIVRPGAVYGPAEVDMFNLFKAARNGIDLYFGNRDKRASLVYVDDLLDAMVNAAQADTTLGRGYLIGDGIHYTWQDIQTQIVSAVGRRTLRVNLPSFLVGAAGIAGELMTAVDRKPRLLNRQKALIDAQRAWLCSIEAAQRDFGYTPKVSLAEGTRRAYAWYVENGWL